MLLAESVILSMLRSMVPLLCQLSCACRTEMTACAGQRPRCSQQACGLRLLDDQIGDALRLFFMGQMTHT